MVGNPFGHGIPLREGSPIQLVRYEKHDSDEFGKIYVVPEALEILQGIKEPVAVIAVVGSYRRGKSWFANALHGRHDGFELGAQVSGCTRGIYMWDTPFVYEDKRVVVLDTEGIDDPNQEAEWATKLFILCLVLSSTFIYNINGVVGSGDVGKLFLMQDLSRYIKPPEDSKYLPHLVILLRDFGLERPDSLKHYFLNQLAKISREAADGIKKSFKEFSVFALPHPGVGRKRLQQMQAVSTHNLDEEFIEETVESVKQIYRRLEPKYIGHLKMNGLSFAKFLTDCVEKMNDPENNAHLSIPNEYETVTQYVAQNMRDRCLGLYRQALEELIESIPMSWDEFTQRHQAIFDTIMKEYVGGLVGTLKQIETFREKFHRDMEEAKKPYYDKNSKELYAFNIGQAKTLWEQLIEPGLQFDQKFTEDEFRGAITNFEQQFAQRWIESPEAMEALKHYKENYYKAAIDTLTNFDVFDEKLAEEMKEREKLNEQYLELAQKEMELNNKLLERDQQMQTVKEALDAKNQEIEEVMAKQRETLANYEKLIVQNERALEEMNRQHREEIERLRHQLQEAQKKKKDFWDRLLGTALGVVLDGVVKKLIPGL